MRFVLPANVLKQEEWNTIEIVYQRGNPKFGIKINKPRDADFTMIPILDFDNEAVFEIILNDRTVVEK